MHGTASNILTVREREEGEGRRNVKGGEEILKEKGEGRGRNIKGDEGRM